MTEEQEGLPSLLDLFAQMTYDKRAKSYKANGETVLSQGKRREERLRAQQQSRFNYQKLARETLASCNEGVVSLAGEMAEELGGTEERGKKRKAEEISVMTHKDKTNEAQQRRYKDKLMSPEPFEEVPEPEELANNWLCIPIPAGRRVLVISQQNSTQIRLRNGTLLTTFQSLLPGGGRKSASNKMHCILDCMLYEPSFTLYVLDILVWKGDLYYDCDSEFRAFWTFNKLCEEDGLGSDKPYSFKPLERFNCDPENLRRLGQGSFPFGAPSEYFLYHKEAHYWAGQNPLMGQVQDISELMK